jgi:hypothetical protein
MCEQPLISRGTDEEIPLLNDMIDSEYKPLCFDTKDKQRCTNPENHS